MQRRPSPAISVVIPHLNQPEGLRRCLCSLAEQNFDRDRVEIVVVDNGSTALPIQVCRQHPKVHLTREPTPGPGPARNRGISESQADILAFIDADCIADPNWLAAIEEVFSDPTTHIVGGDVRISRENPKGTTQLEAYESVFAYRQEEYIRRKGFSGTGNLSVRRSAFNKVGPFFGIDVAEDRHWGQRATGLGFEIRYVPAMVVVHPARKEVRELFLKWDRQISHDFSERERGLLNDLAWALRAFMVGCSALIDIRRILGSRRISGWHERWLATVVLIRTRLYRAGRMTALLIDREKSIASRAWNRS